MKNILNLLVLISAMAGQIFAGEIPRLSDLVLPDPIGISGFGVLTRAQKELSGTGIGKYEYPYGEGFPIITISYFQKDTSLGDRSVDPAISSARYIETVMSLKSEAEIAEKAPPLRETINGIDCLVSDYPNQEMRKGYLLKQFVVEFYIPEHKRVYAIQYEAFWKDGAPNSYNHKFTPQLIRKAVSDFINHNR